MPDGRVVFAQTDDHGVVTARLPGEVDDRNLSWLDASGVTDISRDGQAVALHGDRPGRRRRRPPPISAERTALQRSDWGAASPCPSRLTRGGPSGCSRRPIRRRPYLEIIPTGAGDSQRLPGNGLSYTAARWLPDGKRIVVFGVRVGPSTRLYLVEPDAAEPTPISPEVGRWVVSPDGSTIAASGPDAIRLYPVDGSAPRDVPGLTGRETPIGWITDGLLVMSLADRARETSSRWTSGPAARNSGRTSCRATRRASCCSTRRCRAGRPLAGLHVVPRAEQSVHPGTPEPEPLHRPAHLRRAAGGLCVPGAVRRR